MRQEEKLLNMEVDYKSMEEAVQSLKVVNKQLREKYKQALNEIKDLDKEGSQKNQDLLDTIRTQERDLNFYKALTLMVMSEEDIQKIRGDCKTDDNFDYVVPPFYFKKNKLHFPNIPRAQAMDIVMNEREQ